MSLEIVYRSLENPPASLITSLWVDAIEQKDPDYYRYIAAHGRHTASGQREENRYLARQLDSAEFYNVFAYARTEETETPVGYILGRMNSKDTCKVSRACSLKQLGDTELTDFAIGSRLVQDFVSVIPERATTLFTEAHASSAPFWEKMGLAKCSNVAFAYGLNVVDMTAVLPLPARGVLPAPSTPSSL